MINVTFPVGRAGIDYSIEHNQDENPSPFSLVTTIFKTCCYSENFNKQNQKAKNLEKY